MFPFIRIKVVLHLQSRFKNIITKIFSTIVKNKVNIDFLPGRSFFLMLLDVVVVM